MGDLLVYLRNTFTLRINLVFKDEVIFKSWNSIFQYGGSMIDPDLIYSFERRQIMNDARW